MSTTSDTSVVPQRLTLATHSVFERAEGIARTFFHSHLGPEHVLIALVECALSDEPAFRTLRRCLENLVKKYRIPNIRAIVGGVERKIVTGRAEEMEKNWKPVRNHLIGRLLQHASLYTHSENDSVEPGCLLAAILALNQENIATATLREMGFRSGDIRQEFDLHFERVPSLVRTTMFHELGEGEVFVVIHPEGDLVSLLEVYRGDAVVFCVTAVSPNSGSHEINAVGFFNADIKVHILPDQLVQRCV